MSTQIAVRLPDELVAFLDEQVASGASKSRADFVWQAIEREKRRLVTLRDLDVLDRHPYGEFDAVHDAVAQRGYPSPD